MVPTCSFPLSTPNHTSEQTQTARHICRRVLLPAWRECTSKLELMLKCGMVKCMKNYTLHWRKTSFNDYSLSTAPNSARAQFEQSVSFVFVYWGNGSGSIQVMAGWQWLKCTFEHVISSVTELSAQESSASADTHTHTHTQGPVCRPPMRSVLHTPCQTTGKSHYSLSFGKRQMPLHLHTCFLTA